MVMRQTQEPRPAYKRSEASLELCVWLGPVPTPDREPSVGESVSLFRAGCGKLPVRFDERKQDRTSQTGLKVTRRKPSELTTGRLRHCALFSTLLADAARLHRVLAQVHAVMHFAAHAYVGELVENPAQVFPQ